MSEHEEAVWALGLLQRRVETLTEMNEFLEQVAARYRQALVEILEDCGHDRPDIAKLAAYANSALHPRGGGV